MFSGFKSRCVIPAAWAVRESLRDLQRQIDGFSLREFADSAQSLAVNQFTHQKILTDIVYCNNVGMVQRSHGARFLFESVAPNWVTSEVRGQHLQGDVAV